jgi:hypothetical protein
MYGLHGDTSDPTPGVTVWVIFVGIPPGEPERRVIFSVLQRRGNLPFRPAIPISRGVLMLAPSAAYTHALSVGHGNILVTVLT